MRCREARDCISSLVLRGSVLTSELQSHLSGCEKCSEYLRVVRIERSVFQAIKPEAVEPDSFFASRVLARLRSQTFAAERETLLSLWRAAIQMIPVALAIVIFSLAAVLFSTPREEPPQPILDSVLQSSRLTPTERMILVEQKLDKERILETIVGEVKKNGD